MDKILTLFKREYRAAVRTKSFLISLLMVPLLMGGGFLAVVLMEKKQDNEDKNFVVIDHSGLMTGPLKTSLDLRNQNDIIDPETEEKVQSAYIVEFVEPANDQMEQHRQL